MKKRNGITISNNHGGLKMKKEMELQSVTLFGQRHQLLVSEDQYRHKQNHVDQMKDWLTWAEGHVVKVSRIIQELENKKAQLPHNSQSKRIQLKISSIEKEIKQFVDQRQRYQESIKEHKSVIAQCENVLAREAGMSALSP